MSILRGEEINPCTVELTSTAGNSTDVVVTIIISFRLEVDQVHSRKKTSISLRRAHEPKPNIKIAELPPCKATRLSFPHS
jgi:hypothetical protein